MSQRHTLFVSERLGAGPACVAVDLGSERASRTRRFEDLWVLGDPPRPFVPLRMGSVAMQSSVDTVTGKRATDVLVDGSPPPELSAFNELLGLAQNRVQMRTDDPFDDGLPVFIASDPALRPMTINALLKLSVATLAELPDVIASIAYWRDAMKWFRSLDANTPDTQAPIELLARHTPVSAGMLLPAEVQSPSGPIPSVIVFRVAIAEQLFASTLFLSDAVRMLPSGTRITRRASWREGEAGTLREVTAEIAVLQGELKGTEN